MVKLRRAFEQIWVQTAPNVQTDWWDPQLSDRRLSITDLK